MATSERTHEIVTIGGQEYKGPIPETQMRMIEAESWRPPKLPMPALVEYARARGVKQWSTMIVTGVSERRIEGFIFEADQMPKLKDRVYHFKDPLLDLRPEWLREEDSGVYRETAFTKLTQNADALLKLLGADPKTDPNETIINALVDLGRRVSALETRKSK